jgi:uncharacterized RDD family membrane protein YckC
MNKQLLQDLVEELKARYATLTRMWKPYARVIWVISIPTFVSAFVINTGSFTLIVVGLIALACFLVFAPPFAGSYLLGLRVLALLADLLLVSFASLMAWTAYSDFQLEHQGQALMVTLWATFFYFVLFDWRFKGTLGKKLCGLRVASTEGSKIDFCKSFLRVFATFIFPIMCGSYLQEKIVGDDSSRIRFFLGSGLGCSDIFHSDVDYLLRRKPIDCRQNSGRLGAAGKASPEGRARHHAKYMGTLGKTEHLGTAHLLNVSLVFPLNLSVVFGRLENGDCWTSRTATRKIYGAIPVCRRPKHNRTPLDLPANGSQGTPIYRTKYPNVRYISESIFVPSRRFAYQSTVKPRTIFRTAEASALGKSYFSSTYLLSG